MTTDHNQHGYARPERNHQDDGRPLPAGTPSRKSGENSIRRRPALEFRRATERGRKLMRGEDDATLRGREALRAIAASKAAKKMSGHFRQRGGCEMSKRVGRPSKFTPATVSKILRSVARNDPRHAASTGGISFQTLTAYRSQRPAFADALAQAVAKGIEARLKVVERAMDSPGQKQSVCELPAGIWRTHSPGAFHKKQNRVDRRGQLAALPGPSRSYLPQKDGGDGSPLVTVDTVKEIGNGN